MEKGNANGIVTFVVIVMVFFSGCTNTKSPEAAPVATHAMQTADVIPPVSPSPATTTLTPEPAALTPAPAKTTPAPATAVPTPNGTGYDGQRYTDTNTQPASSTKDDSSGGLIINIRAGGSVEGLKVFIARAGTNVSPIVYSFLPDRTVVEGENKGYIQVKIPPDGRSGVVNLAPGTYTAYLPDWNNGAPEEQSFTIRKDEVTPIWLQGFAANSGGCGC